jgi:hypothetical protein
MNRGERSRGPSARPRSPSRARTSPWPASVYDGCAAPHGHRPLARDPARPSAKLPAVDLSARPCRTCRSRRVAEPPRHPARRDTPPAPTTRAADIGARRQAHSRSATREAAPSATVQGPLKTVKDTMPPPAEGIRAAHGGAECGFFPSDRGEAVHGGTSEATPPRSATGEGRRGTGAASAGVACPGSGPLAGDLRRRSPASGLLRCSDSWDRCRNDRYRHAEDKKPRNARSSRKTADSPAYIRPFRVFRGFRSLREDAPVVFESSLRVT